MIKAIIFDIGGVITNDLWETLYFNGDSSILKNKNILKYDLEIVGKQLWQEYSLINTDSEKLEKKYWHDFNKITGLNLDIKYMESLAEKSIYEIKGAYEVIKKLLDEKFNVGICSDNTVFWFEKQLKVLKILKLIRSDFYVLSYKCNSKKSDSNHKMYSEIINKFQVNKAEILFIDDRVENIESAIQFGFSAILFPSHSLYGYRYLNKLFQQLNIY